MEEAVIIDGVRTPFGRHRGALSGVRPDDMAAHVISALLERYPIAKEAVEEVVFGCANQAGEDNRNVARMALLLAGLPYEMPGFTVNRLCGSGLEAVIQCARAIRQGEGEVLIAGGVESMTRAPYVMEKASEPYPRTPPAIYDTALGWRFPNPRMEAMFPLLSMGETAEEVAREYKISREDQDAFALESHRRAVEAWKNGRFEREVVPIPIQGKKGASEVLSQDEGPRPDTSLEALSKLKPVFRKDGTVTAGNSSPLNDGAAALLIASKKWAIRHGLRPLARILAWAAAGVHPNLMGIGPVPATRKALERAGLRIEDIGLVELNEAFAAQALACLRLLNLDHSRVNVNGGAIAIGHPLGASGARLAATLAHGLVQHKERYGLATMCIG
ncbi:MAG: acetyl-CoA C-acyltransferase, partial [Sandaracinaceae bacterium]|nr:acetyl-CoA C-acyltransferase [Sandaracinaceae bacterium]